MTSCAGSESTADGQSQRGGGGCKRVQIELGGGGVWEEAGGGGGGYGSEVSGFTVIHHAVIRQTGTHEWPSLFPPERPANGGAALSLFTARSS